MAALQASGGTELLQPMLAAVQGVPDGVVVLLTDGQVGNEAEILKAVLAARKTTRIYSFGIGTNVSDALLQDMARQTGGAVEFIHPGERIDDKVVAQFSRALAPRVTELEATLRGRGGRRAGSGRAAAAGGRQCRGRCSAATPRRARAR